MRLTPEMIAEAERCLLKPGDPPPPERDPAATTFADALEAARENAQGLWNARRAVIAIHEAAHAVVAEVLGYGIIYARVSRNGEADLAGHVIYCEGGRPLDRITAALAGAKAVEALCFGWRGPDGGGDADNELTDRALAEAELALENAAHDLQVEMQELERRAAGLVRENRSAILRTARLLFDESVVDGTRVALVVETRRRRVISRSQNADRQGTHRKKSPDPHAQHPAGR